MVGISWLLKLNLSARGRLMEHREQWSQNDKLLNVKFNLTQKSLCWQNLQSNYIAKSICYLTILQGLGSLWSKTLWLCFWHHSTTSGRWNSSLWFLGGDRQRIIKYLPFPQKHTWAAGMAEPWVLLKPSHLEIWSVAQAEEPAPYWVLSTLQEKPSPHRKSPLNAVLLSEIPASHSCTRENMLSAASAISNTDQWEGEADHRFSYIFLPESAPRQTSCSHSYISGNLCWKGKIISASGNPELLHRYWSKVSPAQINA